ncbi:MAG TPA: hypothetical protein VHZ03_38335 [Trebonia sp.]|jgi:hypothetical protein|nr:hypothetical protein [Trebonia sp.]
MPVPVPSTSGDDPGGPPEADALAARVAAGPGLWEDGHPRVVGIVDPDAGSGEAPMPTGSGHYLP